jgi:hypothetical protein
METTMDHFGQWWAVAIWIAMFGLFLLTVA